MGGRADGAEERALALVAQHVDGGIGQGGASLLKGLEAGLEVDKVELELERGGEGFEDATAGGDDFLADAVTGDEAWDGLARAGKREEMMMVLEMGGKGGIRTDSERAN